MSQLANSGTTTGSPLPDVPKFSMPFYYANLVNCAIYYLVDVDRTRPFLQGTGLSPATFCEQALVSYNFQVYSGQFSAGRDLPPEQWSLQAMGVTQELELNILAYPTDRAAQVAQVTAEQFILGEEQSKILGNHRVHVPCDSDLAIAAGVTLFGEPKFKTTFLTNLPSYNPVRKAGPDYHPEWAQKWGFRVNDPANQTTAIFTALADLEGLVSVPASVAMITEYGKFKDKLIGCRWEFLGPMTTYFLDGDRADRVKLTYGTSTHKMKDDMQTLIGDARAYAVQTYLSAPTATQHRAYCP